MKYIFYISISLLIAAPVILLIIGGDIEIGEVISILVLAVTALVIGIQAITTKEIERNRRIPAVEVYMKYDERNERGGYTFFEFFNFSSIPAFLSIDITFDLPRKDPEHIGPGEDGHYRIGPKIRTKTTATFFKDGGQIIHKDGISAKLHITIKNALSNDRNLKMTYTKKYIFKDDSMGKRWNEKTWGFTEPIPFFNESEY